MACDPAIPAIGINPTEMCPVELEATYNNVLTVNKWLRIHTMKTKDKE